MDLNDNTKDSDDKEIERREREREREREESTSCHFSPCLSFPCFPLSLTLLCLAGASL